MLLAWNEQLVVLTFQLQDEKLTEVLPAAQRVLMTPHSDAMFTGTPTGVYPFQPRPSRQP